MIIISYFAERLNVKEDVFIFLKSLLRLENRCCKRLPDCLERKKNASFTAILPKGLKLRQLKLTAASPSLRFRA